MIVKGGLLLLILRVILLLLNNADYLSKTKHDSQRWAVVTDSKGDIIAVETTDPEVWAVFKALWLNQTERWIGGFVEEYDNYWGFRFRPDSIVVAEITIEGAQSNIGGISGDLDYWINVWSKQAYVLATVSELHE
jgi:hypothetical protein